MYIAAIMGIVSLADLKYLEDVVLWKNGYMFLFNIY